MGIDTALLLLSLLSFAALIAVWVAAPLHADHAVAPATDAAGNTVTA